MSDVIFLIEAAKMEEDIKKDICYVETLIMDLKDTINNYAEMQDMWLDYCPNGDYGNEYLKPATNKNLQKLEDILNTLKKVKFE